MIRTLRSLLANAERAVVLTGAGVSTDSGIPDFRGPRGSWTLDPRLEHLTHWPSYRDVLAVRRRSWRWRASNPALYAEPNASHVALAALVASGRVSALVTQNVDGLHLAAGTDPARLHELHGSIRDVVCVACPWRAPMSWALSQLADGVADPRCPDCGDITKVGTVFFGETLPTEALDAAVDATSRCDLFLAVGTSLQVQPAAGLPLLAVQCGAPFVIINAEPTPLDDLATLLVREPIGDVLPPAISDLVAS